MSEKYIRVEDIPKVCDNTKDWGVEQYTIDDLRGHGHWDNKIIDARFDIPHTVARCSNCKGKIWVYAENYVVKYPYCPLCGAKMDEVEDGKAD